MLGSFAGGLFEGAKTALEIRKGLDDISDWDLHDAASKEARDRAKQADEDAHNLPDYTSMDTQVSVPGQSTTGSGDASSTSTIPPYTGATTPTTKPAIDSSATSLSSGGISTIGTYRGSRVSPASPAAASRPHPMRHRRAPLVGLFQP